TDGSTSSARPSSRQFRRCRVERTRGGAISRTPTLREPATTAAASARFRRISTGDWPRWRSSEREPVRDLPEQNVQDDDQQDDAVDTQVHGFTPSFIPRR